MSWEWVILILGLVWAIVAIIAIAAAVSMWNKDDKEKIGQDR